MKSSINNPLVSVIVPTKNSSKTIKRCLESVRNQSYRNLEIIVVDNHSTDKTLEIASQLADHVYTHGPERSAQVNFGVSQAKGELVYKVDSDFVLDPDVISQSVAKIAEGYDAVVVHNSPDVSISWIAKIRKFEVDMYKYDLTHSSARFLKKSIFEKIDGFNETITAGEDYDFQNKLNKKGFKIGFVVAEALHLGEPTSLWPHLAKYFVYGRDFVHYASVNKKESSRQLNIIRPVYLRRWKKFIRQPLLGLAFIGYSLLKFIFGGAGFVYGLFFPKFK